VPGRDLHIDLGTGDGKFVLRCARAHPDVEHVGVDALEEPMRDSIRRAGAKPARGGVANAWFVVADAASPPAELAGRASLVTVNYPWGSLLRAVVVPEPAIVELLRPGGRLVALLNASAAEDHAYAEKLDLPALEEQRLVRAWCAAGLVEVAWRTLDPGEDPPHRTTWGQRLVRGSGRSTVYVSGVRA
jgi:16S rRNA (adenine(1408)-N(1))-methyltransferase